MLSRGDFTKIILIIILNVTVLANKAYADNTYVGSFKINMTPYSGVLRGGSGVRKYSFNCYLEYPVESLSVRKPNRSLGFLAGSSPESIEIAFSPHYDESTQTWSAPFEQVGEAQTRLSPLTNVNMQFGERLLLNGQGFSLEGGNVELVCVKGF
jgi:hypothetical protein